MRNRVVGRVEDGAVEREKAATVLEPLRRTLPEIPGEALIDEECGETYYRGFGGDVSQCARFVTDGRILLLASAVDPSVTIEKNEDCYLGRKVTEEKIELVWKPVTSRDDVSAGLLGVAEYGGEGSEVAFVRDLKGRVMVLNAHLLAFGLKAVRPDALTVSATKIEATCLRAGQQPWFDLPLAMRRNGQLVALLMPMKLGLSDFARCDLAVEPMELATVCG